MYSFVLQDWITLGGFSSSQIIQTEQDWLDMTPYQDVVAWLDVREASTSPAAKIYLETAPSKDGSLFMPMLAGGTALGAAPTPVIVQLLMGSAAVPIAQYLRWRVQGTGGPLSLWDTTFRILVAANAPGLQPPTGG